MRTSLLLLFAGLGATVPGHAAGPAETVPAAVLTPLDRAAQLMAKGIAAEARIASNSAAERQQAASDLMRVGEALAVAGAQPADDTAADQAAQWRAQALAAGAKPRASVLRGRALGPSYRRAPIGRDASFSSEQVFMAGQAARVRLVPGFGMKMQLSVLDGKGKSVCKADISDKPGGCDWLPLYTQRHTVTVINLATKSGEFVLLTN